RLRNALAWLFFDETIADAAGRLQVFEKAIAEPSENVQLAFLHELAARLEPGTKQRVLPTVKEHWQRHVDYLQYGKEVLGDNWLVTPRLPLELPDGKERFEFTNIGRELMRGVLSLGSNRAKLVDGLGEQISKSPSADIVAVMFSTSEAFGGS